MVRASFAGRFDLELGLEVRGSSSGVVLVGGVFVEMGEDDEEPQEGREVAAHELPGDPDLAGAAAVFEGVGVPLRRSGAGAVASAAGSPSIGGRGMRVTHARSPID
jgi:hypothetical protein